MGYYDSCYEADEEREREKWVNKCRSCGEHPKFTETE